MKPKTLWKGVLNTHSSQVQAFAQQLCETIPPESADRFCAKMLYWRDNIPQNPIQITAGADRIFAITQGNSRFLASVVLNRPCGTRLWAYHQTREFPIEQYLDRARQQQLKHQKPTAWYHQHSVEGFESALEALLPELAKQGSTPQNLDEWRDYMGDSPKTRSALR